jgi:hypothetical protein
LQLIWLIKRVFFYGGGGGDDGGFGDLVRKFVEVFEIVISVVDGGVSAINTGDCRITGGLTASIHYRSRNHSLSF